MPYSTFLHRYLYLTARCILIFHVALSVSLFLISLAISLDTILKWILKLNNREFNFFSIVLREKKDRLQDNYIYRSFQFRLFCKVYRRIDTFYESILFYQVTCCSRYAPATSYVTLDRPLSSYRISRCIRR